MPTSLGPAEILVILVVALIVLGPERLPKAARQIGKALAEVKHWSGGIQDEVRNAFNADPDPQPQPQPSQPSPQPDPPAPSADTPDGPSLN
ncbi:MAG: Sec-independent protein translocase protein TatB [Actinomycetota bacterium]|nr:Sec-independent protein translocase protein TatB [Actinomycetota bacterium]